MPEITEPLRLAVGSHQAGSGMGCAMNVISWENGDTTITDYPDCADTQLAWYVQLANDKHCTHRDGPYLCSPCSVEVLDLAHRTVGTRGAGDRLGDARFQPIMERYYFTYNILWAAPAQRHRARLAAAHAAIDLFEELTGHKPTPTNPAVTAEAVAKMKETVSAR